MKVICNSGLCNRLGVLLGYREACRRMGSHLTFIWLDNRYCGPLEDAFSVDDVTIEHASQISPDVPAIPGKAGFNDIVQIYGVTAKEKVALEAYRQIRFDPVLVEAASIGAQTHLAVHARVTDLYRSTGKVLSISDCFRQIEETSKSQEVFPLYLATDALEVQQMFRQRYGAPQVITRATLDPGKFRQSSLREAVIDLLACAQSKHFFGTPGSSFSRTVQIFRTLKGHGKSSSQLIGMVKPTRYF